MGYKILNPIHIAYPPPYIENLNPESSRQIVYNSTRGSLLDQSLIRHEALWSEYELAPTGPCVKDRSLTRNTVLPSEI